ncbi:immediate early response gene 2 protein [Melozone crissalis]|uniref:immediate early response gene 2 protein n=1 Tax=Melozone crissalis TaxID=40204 RepID=UPI0023DAFE03|nr:immediate early response gene 2 protein [Melozone crissalis]
MEEAQRLLTVSVWKLYRCRVRRGGLRLHRSLQLSMLVRAARHRYLSARAAAGILPGLEITGNAVNGATPVPGIHGAAVNGASPVPGITGNAVNGATPVPGIHGAAVNGASPVPGITGNAVNGATPVPGIHGAAVNGAIPGPGGGPSGDSLCPNPPSANRPDRAMNRTEQERGTPLRDCTGDHRNAPSGAPRSGWYRGCAPVQPSEEPPGPANQDPPPAAPGPPRPTGAPRAGQKRRSSGSAGPGRGPVPSKRARLEAEAPPGPPGRCSGPPAAAFGFLVRAVGAC